MEEIVAFFKEFGLPLTAIAICGIISLGIMKYCHLFTKIDEKIRHLVYIAISVAISIAGSCIYLACVHKFDISYILTFVPIVYALNQTWYNIFKATEFNELMSKLLTKVMSMIKR